MKRNPTNAALVLEGGGLRGVFTYGVSMGACNGANYVARQPERNRMVNIGFVGDRCCLSWTRLLRGPEPHGRLAGVSGGLKKRADLLFPLINPRDESIAAHLR